MILIVATIRACPSYFGIMSRGIPIAVLPPQEDQPQVYKNMLQLRAFPLFDMKLRVASNISLFIFASLVNLCPVQGHLSKSSLEYRCLIACAKQGHCLWFYVYCMFTGCNEVKIVVMEELKGNVQKE